MRYSKDKIAKFIGCKVHLSNFKQLVGFPLVIVPKKGGNWRVCVDYKELNVATRKDHFPLPFIGQVLDSLAGNKYFSFLYGFSGHNQIKIAPEDQDKTTFTCQWGTYAYLILPFGIFNALATF